MNIRHLDHFLAVLNCGSLSRAAEKTGISQSGLTKSIRALEDLVAMPLLERQSRGMRPNPQGEALAHRARLIVAQWREARRELEALRDGAAGRLTIGAGPSWMRRGLPEAIAQLLQASPGAEVKVTGGFDAQLIEALKQGEYDLIIAACEEARHDRALEVVPLTRDRQSVIARRGHPLAARSDLAIADLADAGWALPSRRMAQRQRFNAIFAYNGLHEPAPAIESDSIAFIFEVVKKTDLLSFATSSIFKPSAKDEIVSLEVAGIGWERHAGIIMRADEARSMLAEMLTRRLFDVAAEMRVN